MAFDMFLQISGIPGESTDANHPDWIEVLSYSHGLSLPTSGSVGSGGAPASARCDHQEFTIVHYLDKASPKLAIAACQGQNIPEVILELAQAAGNKRRFMEYKLMNALVMGVRPTGSAGGGETRPMEEVKFVYSRIEWTYTVLDPNTGAPMGDITAHWDLQLNRGG